MGEQRKKFNGLRYSALSVLLIFACLLMTFVFCIINLNQVVTPVANLTTQSKTDVEYWTEVRDNGFFHKDEEKKICYIYSYGELAFMCYDINRLGGEDYSGYTFVLQNDIDLTSFHIGNQNRDVNPLWTPIDIGSLGKNKNISFDGKGHKIKGMRIEYNTAEPCSVGFFANMIGGIFENVTFENPIITYTYTGVSINKESPNRPDHPTDVCVGVVAGAADSTYIRNVNIINPTIEFTSDNVNAHNLCLGTAVGKLSFTRDSQTSSINTASPKKWGIDAVNVIGDNTHVATITINKGTDNTASYGKATYGYFGGLVGVNVSSKIINSTLKNYTFTPDIADDVEGNFYVGGLAGLTTQITTASNLIVAAGLYNNLLLNVNLGAITDNNTRYCGNLVGRVYCGGWVYNNLVIGVMPYENLWGDIANTVIFTFSENGHNDDCLGLHLGNLDDYYFTNYFNNHTYCSIVKTSFTTEPGHEYTHCSAHQGNEFHLYSEGDLSQYNFKYNSSNDVTSQQLELMSSLDESTGLLQYASLPIRQYETGLTVTTTDGYDQFLEAIYQFKTWTLNASSEPMLDEYIGSDRSIRFMANSPSDSEAYFDEGEDNGYGPSEITVPYTYQQIITAPETPKCTGYDFMGWRVEGWGDTPTNYYENGYYVFNQERIEQAGRVFYAVWERHEYTVNYVIRKYRSDNSTMDVSYNIQGAPVKQKAKFNLGITSAPTEPTSNDGLKFFGWFRENDLPGAYGVTPDVSKKWRYGQENPDKMPASDITLYSGWINNYAELNLLLEDEDYIKYYRFYNIYFTESTGRTFKNAYEAARDSINNQNANINALLNNLKTAHDDLCIVPQNLLNAPAFNSTSVENTCPCLFNDVEYSNFTLIKEQVQSYIEQNLLSVTDVVGYINVYDFLEEMRVKLRNSLKPSFASDGGIDSNKIQSLVQKYQDLEKRYEKLYQDGNYVQYDMAALDEAERSAKEKWMTSSSNLEFVDIKTLVDNYETAFNNLKPKNANNADVKENTNNSANSAQMGIPPVLLGVIIVLIIALGISGYIGIDFVLYKRGAAPKTETTKTITVKTKEPKSEKQSSQSQVSRQETTVKVNEEPDDETYI